MEGRIREFLTNLAAVVCICATLVAMLFIAFGIGY